MFFKVHVEYPNVQKSKTNFSEFYETVVCDLLANEFFW